MAALNKIDQFKLQMDGIYNKYNTEDLLKDFANNVKKDDKNIIEPIYSRIEFNPKIKCGIKDCVKIASHKNIFNDKNICWFHVYSHCG